MERHPPAGSFITVDGVRLHYLDRGRGAPVVLLHGNAVRMEDFTASGLIDRLAEHCRVIAFDRPGFGYSSRPRDRLWTANAQAALLEQALGSMGIERPTVLGHSWGTLVALALALRPAAAVRKLVLVSGYYYPTARLDVALTLPVAIPVVGDVLRYTVSAALARLLLARTVKAMFAPEAVPAQYLKQLSREMLLRPVQLRASAEEGTLMIPSASALAKRYAELQMPAVIFAGEGDAIIDPDAQARRLHAELARSELHVLPGRGHMLHHADVGELVAAVTSDGSSSPSNRREVAKALPGHEGDADDRREHFVR